MSDFQTITVDAEMATSDDAQRPYFSVVMCCNRDEGYIHQAIQSVLAQSFSLFEFVIVLNACTDELYASVAAITDPRIVLLRTEIGQLAFNLNLGVNSAKGEYIVRFDSDDICHVDRLAESYNLIRTDPAIDIVAGSCRIIDAAGTVIGARALREQNWRSRIIYSNPFVHPAIAIRRDLILRARGYSGGFQSEDYDLWIRLAKRTDVKCIFTSFPMIDYRVSDFQSKGSRQAYAEVASYFLREFLIKPGFRRFFSVLLSISKVFFKSKK
ncbi:glycosyltransferase [Pseudomonas sp. SWRI18]|uniref:glycosyltransferase n=1 Tax=Pseudomonas sp. SWRI18 TaxID=2753888 RepID=UPI00164633CB|nr:glycosyltransferase [Pseudomonas sp. SWRI18]MBC3303301.1 glycosyltransferase [Pseudomonas sp. SWRI18]